MKFATIYPIDNQIRVHFTRQMQKAKLNRKMIDCYLELFKNLSPDDKHALISGLSDSLKADKKQASATLKSVKGDFIPEKSAEAITDYLKQSRNFTRENESLDI